MSSADIVMPMFGQAMEFGVLVEWLAADGATVAAGQAIASIESDKATYEIEAPVGGLLTHRAAVGAEVPVGNLLGVIGGEAEGAAVGADVPTRLETTPGRPGLDPGSRFSFHGHEGSGGPDRVRGDDVSLTARPLASPKARELAKTTGVDLARVTTTRPDGVIVAADVAQHNPQHMASSGTSIPLTSLRRAAARRLAQSWSQAPHFTQMIEADATALVAAQASIRAGRLACSLNDILIRAAALTMAEFPDINASFADEALQPLPDIAVGLAVATEGGLAVPVVRDAAARTLEEIATETRRLIELGRQGRVSAADMGRASLTLSNLGRYGVAFGTPVLNLGEPVLVFIGAIEQKAIGIEGEIVLQPRTMLSICYDHRVVDGLRAAQFSQALKLRLESLTDVLPGEASAVADREAPRFADGKLKLRLGETELLVGAGDARLLAIAAALAALTSELPKAGPTARKLRGIVVRIEDGLAATLLCDSEVQANLVRRAIEATNIRAYSPATLSSALKAERP